jgi:ferritin-like metal-binding protein YciE
MAFASMKELYLDELGDLYDAEAQSIRTLLQLYERAKAPELRETLALHCQESRLHMERLQLIFTHWGQPVWPRNCTGVAGIVQETDDHLNQVTTADVRDAAIIGVACRIEHYEIAGYGCACAYARRLNRPDEARLLQETLDEETRADRRLTDIVGGKAYRDDAHVAEEAESPGSVSTADADRGANANPNAPLQPPQWGTRRAASSHARAQRSVSEPRSHAAHRSAGR